jgi:DHA3 family macrolide efflux protein-like MFS transporter
MSGTSSSSGLRVFATVWAGQVISLVGSNLTNFAVGVWVYQSTGSATKFSLVCICLTVPGLLVAPLAGALVDRWDRRWSMLLGDGCDALLRLPLLYFAATGRLALWHVYSIVALSSFFHAFQVPAFAASTSLLVPKRHLARANGWVQAGVSAAQILSPLSAGFLLAAIGLTGVVAIDLVTASLGIVSLLIVRLPRPEAAEHPAQQRSSLWHSAVDGWGYLRQRQGFLQLLSLSGSVNFCFGTVYVLLTPLVLSFASSRQLGLVMGAASFGVLAGSLVMGTWGGPQRRIRGIFLFMLAQSLVLSIAVLRPHVGVLAAGAFAYMFFNPLNLGSIRTLLQTKIAPAMQGRVFAFAGMIASSSIPLAAVVAGPLADRVFEPSMAPGGRLAASAGLLLGVGKGRGIALLCLCAAGLMAVLVLLASRYRPLRRLEQEIPDALPDELPSSLPQETALA